MTRHRSFPAGNPLANALVVIVGALAIALSFILGVVAFVALASVLLVLAAIVGIRIWWLNRRLARSAKRNSEAAQVDVIEGEYRVVTDDDDPAVPRHK